MTEKEYLKDYNLFVTQPEEGYRYNEDSLFLVNNIDKIKKEALIADLGAGSGIISLLLAKKFPSSKIIAVEIDNYSFKFLEKNIEENKLQNQITPLLSDWQDLKKDWNGRFDVIVTNPPFRENKTGKISPFSTKAKARHEITGSLEKLIETVSIILKNRGAFYAVFLSERLTDMLYLLRHRHIEPKELIPIYPDFKKPSSVFIVKGIKNAGRAIKVLQPIFRR